jgi:hypothetical protein
VTKWKLRSRDGYEADEIFDIPDGTIGHLTMECGGKVHGRHVVEVTCESFEKEVHGANPHSGVCDHNPEHAADLKINSGFMSAFRHYSDMIWHTRNTWLCHDFKETRIVPTHYSVRTNGDFPGGCHLKSWLVETSADGENWWEVAREEDKQ